MNRPVLTLLGAFVGAALSAAPALAFDFIGSNRVCDDQAVLHSISKRFGYQVRHVPHLPDVDIVDFNRIHQHRFIPATERIRTSQRFCMATATLSDGRRRSVWYVIESGMGFASIGDGVQFCVSGFDRWFVYDGSCRILR